MLYVVAAFLAVLTFAFLVYAAVRWTRPGSPGVAWLFASFFLLLCVLLWFGLGDDRPPLPAALVDRGKWGRVAHARLPRPRLRLCNFFHGRPLLGCGVSSTQ